MASEPFHILIVDDQLADAQLFIELFQEAFPGMRFHHACHGLDALDYLNQAGPGRRFFRPQLIVLDLNMPVMNGRHFLEVIKVHPTLRSIPVLILTASEQADDIREAYTLYASGYLVKPSAFQGLEALVKAVGDFWQGTVKLPTVAEFSA